MIYISIYIYIYDCYISKKELELHQVSWSHFLMPVSGQGLVWKLWSQNLPEKRSELPVETAPLVL